MFDFFIKTIVEDGSTTYYPTVAGNIALFVFILLILILATAVSGSLLGSKQPRKMQTKQLVFSALAMALAVVTGLYTVVKLPYGGSITFFRMFFICFIGYLYGPKVGIVTGIAYGLLDMVISPYIVHPIQLLLDYPLAFGSLGLAGFFANKKGGLIKGYILGVFGRYICHLLSGIIFFYMFAPEGSNVVLYSIGYNATYILPEMVATLVILLIPSVQKGLSHVKKMSYDDSIVQQS